MRMTSGANRPDTKPFGSGLSATLRTYGSCSRR
jgi:hypothetical protein